MDQIKGIVQEIVENITSKDAFLEYPIHIHKMFWGAFGINSEPNT